MSRPVLFAEVPHFYAEVERARDPALADRPVIVGGDPRKRGLVQAATPDALARGVRVGMAVLDALQRCPNARSVRTNMRRYREVASQLRACLRRGAERLESAGMGAAYLALPTTAEQPLAASARLREDVVKELGLPLRVGIAPVKFLARLAAEEADRSGLREVQPGEVDSFLHPLPVTRLPGVGPRTASRLAALGVHRIGDVVALGRAALERELGNHGLAILDAARGRGDATIRASGQPRSLSQESTLAAPERDLAVLGERLGELAQRLSDALRLDLLAARRVAVKVRYADLETTTRSCTLARPLVLAAEIETTARELLARTEAGARAVRLLGLSVSSFVRSTRDERQLELFPET